MRHSVAKKRSINHGSVTTYALEFGDGSVILVNKEQFDDANVHEFYDITLTKENTLPSAADLDAVAEEAALAGEVFPTYASWTPQEKALLGQNKPRPTIAELDAILNSEEDTPITINPDGSITA